MTNQLHLTEFKSTDNILLPGLLYEPGQKSDKAAIYLHGNGSASMMYDVNINNILGWQLNKKRISYFSFNNRGAQYIFKLKRIRKDKEKDVLQGMAYELIRDCVYDIDGAINYLKNLGYKTFYLVGISTGANKIVVYDHYKPKNPVSKYILLSGGDDTGLYYQDLGREKFMAALKTAKEKIKKCKGTEMVPKNIVDYYFSWASLYNTLNPDGDYNIFPYNEYMNNLKLSKKPLFSEYKKINKPTLVIYGENDEYIYGDVNKIVGILKKEAVNKDKFTFKIVKGAPHGFDGKEKELAITISNWII